MAVRQATKSLALAVCIVSENDSLYCCLIGQPGGSEYSTMQRSTAECLAVDKSEASHGEYRPSM